MSRKLLLASLLAVMLLACSRRRPRWEIPDGSTAPTGSSAAGPNAPAEQGPPGVQMRMQVLTAAPAQLGFSAPPPVWNVVMDMGLANGNTASLVAFADGNASLYTNGAFGIIGGYAHLPVRAAAQSLCALAPTYLDTATVTREFPYPSPGRIRFYLRTPTEVRTVEEDESVLKSGKHPLSTLFHAGQAVLTALRNSAQQRNVDAGF